MMRPHVAGRGQGLQLWEVAANILKRQPRTADNKGFSSVRGSDGELRALKVKKVQPS
jgi:hypothetical protein